MARTRTASETTKRQLPRRVPPLTTSRAFGSKSPLTDLDLQAFLARCMSMDQWHTYTDSEKKRIFESLPPSRKPASLSFTDGLPEVENLHQTQSPRTASPPLEQQSTCSQILSEPPVDSSTLVTDPFVKRAIARFKRDLGDGYYEKTWQDKARRAHDERMEGKFDDYVRQHAEDMFEDPANEGDDDDQDELAHASEDGEYLDTTTKGRGKTVGRPRKSKRGQ